ncbi:MULTISPECIES: hypothetical protein [Sulfitobacter]|uniref:hypothetical protein n=1 Tax=Sulfitobacter TaxID=60136 RepID=UPI002454D03A|nr:hypothetical protein [Sulfitobacter faviae]MDH4541082.1 hypothetical protein [Sulfitobacter faviae]
MKLTLLTQGCAIDQEETTASVSGDVITVDGVEYDLSPVPEGGEAKPDGESPFRGKITRKDGVIHANILWRFDTTTAEPDQGTELPVVQITSGDVPDPIARLPEPEPEDPQAEEGEPE